jgi:integrase
VKRILDACDQVKVEWKNETGLGVWTGEDLKDLIWLMLYTGFRISDATLFSMKRLHGDQVFIRAKKNGGDVFAYVPDWLSDRLQVASGAARRAAVHRGAVRPSRDHHKYLATANREGLRRGGIFRRTSDHSPIPAYVRAHPSAAGCARGGRRRSARRRREDCA